MRQYVDVARDQLSLLDEHSWLIALSGCRKGKRECVYPGTPPSASSSRAAHSHPKSKASHDSPSSPSADEDEIDQKPALPVIPDEVEDDSSEVQTTPKDSSSRRVDTNSSSRGPTRPQAIRQTSRHAPKPSISQSSRWHSLPRDVKAYLKYHRESLSHHHYAFKYDGGDFLKTTFLEIAMNDDTQALLYAVVAFAAYHYAVERGDNKISPFLSYYNKAITMLQQSISRKRHSITTLLTILQLATIEVRTLLSLCHDH